MAKQKLGIGVDDFRRVREDNYYYVDKTLMIKDFLEVSNIVSLITRPRRFGKTLNMTMLREFFDIEKDSRDIFDGLAIFDTPYAGEINSRPVIYLTLKNCSGSKLEDMYLSLATCIHSEYLRYNTIFSKHSEFRQKNHSSFHQIHDMLVEVEESAKAGDVFFGENAIRKSMLKKSLTELIKSASLFYNQKVLVLIDEYDQPLIKAHEMEYRTEFSRGVYGSFLGSALKGNDYLDQAVLTGIQRVAKESIFSEVNNFLVFTVTSKRYNSYFGLTEQETAKLLEDYGYTLTDDVKNYYDGYNFAGIDIYNPWSLLSYVDEGELKPYWLNTSTNGLIRELVLNANASFKADFEELIAEGTVDVGVNMEASFMELETSSTLWGLLVNAGYLTTVSKLGLREYILRIPNQESEEEFRSIVELYANIEPDVLMRLFNALFSKNMPRFLKLYRKLITYHVSYHDAPNNDINQLSENSFHMLFLGMSMATLGLYKIESNRESGEGRSDVVMKSVDPSARPHIIIEFKQDENLKTGAQKALNQIKSNRYYAGLTGDILCIGIAHFKKKCELVHEEILVNADDELKTLK